MPSQKSKCSKCLGRHLPPTEKKCKYVLQDAVSSNQAEEDSTVGGPVTRQRRETVAAYVQMQILQQLQSVNKRLDNMEGEVADIKQRSACGKLSSLSLPKNVNSDHDSDSSSDESLVPSLNHLKSAKDIQRQVDSRL